MKNAMFIERKRLTDLKRGELPRPIRLGRNGRYRFIRAEIEPALAKHGIDLARLEEAMAKHNESEC